METTTPAPEAKQPKSDDEIWEQKIEQKQNRYQKSQKMTHEPKPQDDMAKAAEKFAAAADRTATAATFEAVRAATNEPGLSPEQQLLAELALNDAALADIDAMSSDSRMAWELDQLSGDEGS